jgi:hypothetical protein
MLAIATEGAMSQPGPVVTYVVLPIMYLLATAGLVGGWGLLMVLANWLIGGDYGQYR